MSEAELLELTLGGPAAGGGFVARAEDGRVVFVRHGLPGERVRARLTEEHARWARADAIEILDASTDRVLPPCPAAGAGACGGCDYQHASLEAQRKFKSQLLSEQLRRVAKIDIDVPVEAFSTDGLRTRTRVRFGTTEDGHLGMRRRSTTDVIAVERCLLASPAILESDLEPTGWPPGDDVQVVCLPRVDTPTVALVAWEDDDEDVLLDGPGDLLEAGAGVQVAEVGGHRFQVSAESFFQVHLNAADILSAVVLELLSPTEGQHLVDLYAGVGLFSLPLALAVGRAGSVTAVESAPSAAQDARVNLEEQPWAQVIEAPVTPELLIEVLEGADGCVVDPPRAGVDAKSMAAICASDVERVVMVSCNPSTFARDIKTLLDDGFELKTLRALDLFEMTEHLEILALLTR